MVMGEGKRILVKLHLFFFFLFFILFYFSMLEATHLIRQKKKSKTKEGVGDKRVRKGRREGEREPAKLGYLMEAANPSGSNFLLVG